MKNEEVLRGWRLVVRGDRLVRRYDGALPPSPSAFPSSHLFILPSAFTSNGLAIGAQLFGKAR